MYVHVYSVAQFMPYISIQGACYNIMMIIIILASSGNCDLWINCHYYYNIFIHDFVYTKPMATVKDHPIIQYGNIVYS